MSPPLTHRVTDFSLIETLYKTRLKKDFLPNELKPLSSMRRAWNRGAYDAYVLLGDSEILGYAFFVRFGQSRLLDYLAIAENHRGNGLGSVFWRQLSAILPAEECILCEVEDPDKAPDELTRIERERRLRFYLRCGFRQTALSSRVFGADYRLLEASSGTAHPDEQLRRIYTDLYHRTLPAFFFRTQFRVFL